MLGDNTASLEPTSARGDTPPNDSEIARSKQGEAQPGAQFPRVGRELHPQGSTVQIGDVTFGAKDFVVIAGPCAVESQELLDQAARTVVKSGARVLRGGAFKPRTSPDSFQGRGLDGIEMLRRTATEFSLPFVTEVMSAPMVQELESRVDAFQIGARNMQNFALLEAVGRTKTPVLLKRNFGATLGEWLMAAEYVAKGGNDQIILCERGIRSFATETRFTMDLAGAMWVKQRTHLPVIVDPSHAIGLPDLLAGAVAATVAAGLDGAMVEVHPQPDRALCDADQALTPDEFDALMAKIAPIAHAVGRAV